MNIVLSNPAKQHTPQAVFALQKGVHNVRFLTSFWYRPGKWNWQKLLTTIPGFVSQLNKRSSEVVPAETVVTNPVGIIFSLLGRCIHSLEKRSYFEDRLQDYWVKRWVRRSKPELFIGYEKSCRDSFKEVKKYGGICILDLAQVHPLFIEDLRIKYDFFRYITGSGNLFKRVCNTKLEEYQLADYIICLSDFARKTLLDKGVAAEKIKLVNLGFDPNRFKQKDYEVASVRPLQLVFCGSITRRKGVHLLLELMGHLEGRKIELTLVGNLSDDFGFKEAVNINPSIHYHTFLSHSELAEILRQSDVFIFPSFLDSWGMVVIEAMACGLPVIVTENTGSKDAVSEASGFVLPVGDSKQLLEKVIWFDEHREQLQIMGRAARKAAEQFTWADYAKQLNQIMNDLREVSQTKLLVENSLAL